MAKKKMKKKTTKARKKLSKKARKSARKSARKNKPSNATNKKKALAERSLEEGLRETFPGSDSVAVTDPTRSIRE